MSITAQRAQEILALYQQLKEDIVEIDHKYSMSYQKPQLDMPPSLNLTPLEYVPKTQQQLTDLATMQVVSNHTNKVRAFEQGYLKNLQAQYAKQDRLAESLRQKLVKLLADYTKNVEKLTKRLVDNGLIFSSVVTKANEDALTSYNQRVEEANVAHQNAQAIVTDEINAIESRYQEGVESLESELESRIAEAVSDLQYAEDKEQQRIQKYNTSLEEKETKYQASIQRAYEYARQAEYERALTATKLYAELGESGVESQKAFEKYCYARDFFYGWKREEALYVIQADSFMSTHLMEHYSSLLDWINSALSN